MLCLGGLATLAEVFLNGELVLRSESMFARHAIDIGALVRGRNELSIRCRALVPELAVQRRPRARWRTRLVADNNLRWFRTMLLGRIPGVLARPGRGRTVAPGLARTASGPRRRSELELRPRLDGDDGVLSGAGAAQGPRRLARRRRGSRAGRTVRTPPRLAQDVARRWRLMAAEGELRIPDPSSAGGPTPTAYRRCMRRGWWWGPSRP